MVQCLKQVDMPKKILFVDDEADIRRVMNILLKKAGYEVLVYEDDSFIKTLSESSLPDLFILDRRLGNIDALEICYFLKSNTLTSHIPVIIFSADPTVKDLYKGVGADDFIAKPFEVKHFLATIDRYLQKAQAK